MCSPFHVSWLQTDVQCYIHVGETLLWLPAAYSGVNKFTCLKGHLSETYRHTARVRVRVWVRVRTRVRVMVRFRVRVRFSVKFRNLHNYISDKWPVAYSGSSRVYSLYVDQLWLALVIVWLLERYSNHYMFSGDPNTVLRQCLHTTCRVYQECAWGPIVEDRYRDPRFRDIVTSIGMLFPFLQNSRQAQESIMSMFYYTSSCEISDNKYVWWTEWHKYLLCS